MNPKRILRFSFSSLYNDGKRITKSNNRNDQKTLPHILLRAWKLKYIKWFKGTEFSFLTCSFGVQSCWMFFLFFFLNPILECFMPKRVLPFCFWTLCYKFASFLHNVSSFSIFPAVWCFGIFQLALLYNKRAPLLQLLLVFCFIMTGLIATKFFFCLFN